MPKRSEAISFILFLQSLTLILQPMKKILFIAMCCITVLFAACKKDNPVEQVKPNEKFVGCYNGTSWVNGKIFLTNPMPPETPMTQDIDSLDLSMSFDIAAGNADNKVVMTAKPENQEETYTVNGTVSDNNVEFEAFTIERDFAEDQITGTMSATLVMSGTLSGNTLNVVGTITGNGTTTSVITLPFTIEGDMTGTFTKVVTEKR